MGLDNMPHIPPCRREGASVDTADGRIDCTATISAGQCPYRREVAAGPAADVEPVVGMLGTWCWYRGKFGQWLLDELATHDPKAAAAFSDVDAGFYGTATADRALGGTGPDLDPAYLHRLADAFDATADAWAAVVERHHRDAADDLLGQWVYAAWWCRFAADHAGGADAWF